MAEMPDYKHPQCTCDEHDRDDESLMTLELARAMEDYGRSIGAMYPLCQRQLAMACVIIAASQFHKEGDDEAGIREEMQQALEIVLTNRARHLVETSPGTDTVQ